MKRNSLLLAVITPLLCLLSSCGTSTQLEPTQIKKMASEGIVVVEDEDAKPQFTLIGTTAFNNKFETITESGTSFADYMVTRLKAKGYKATKSESKNHPRVLLLYATYPYQQPGMTGVGFHRRSFLGISSPVMAFCNFRGTLLDTQTKSSKHQPINFGDKGYQFGPTPVKRSVKSWSEFTSSEKYQMKSALKNHMRSQADLIISQLGL